MCSRIRRLPVGLWNRALTFEEALNLILTSIVLLINSNIVMLQSIVNYGYSYKRRLCKTRSKTDRAEKNRALFHFLLKKILYIKQRTRALRC